ncbi:MAG: hypothetical protein ILA34_06745 [Bacteroidaceae bacterium]|nr:hypothetical protein [Bacteroidaceae bacterium]
MKNWNSSRILPHCGNRGLLLLLFLVTGMCAGAKTAERRLDFGQVYLDTAQLHDAVALKGVEVFRRVVNGKSEQSLFVSHPTRQSLHVRLTEDGQGLPPESYEISWSGKRELLIAAADGKGVLYGLGKLLHASYVNPRSLSVGHCEGRSVPQKPVRGIYLATHFHNFYDDAPIEEVKDYIEELALWGYNGLQVWFDMHHYTGLDDPKAQAMVNRLRQLLAAGRAVGMGSGLTMLANEGYSTTPSELRAQRIRWTAFYGCEICPSEERGMALILKNREEMLDAFLRNGLDIENVWLWPYDQGGCSCDRCREWGGNGYLKLTKRLAAMMRRKVPHAKLVMSTWLFDFEEQDKGEWKALTRAFDEERPWVDCIMADSHTSFPGYLLSHPVPGGLPLQNFPEISMWQNYPWGGYGANPLPLRFEKLWAQAKDKAEGGYPYSEGKFEDFNKVLYSQFYWQTDRGAEDILREYVAHEFSPRYVDEIKEAILILEKNQGMKSVNWDTHPQEPKVIKVPGYDHGAQRACQLLETVDKKLPPKNRCAWRWRILLLRARLDVALRASNGQVTPEINGMFRELQEISSVRNGDFCVRPPYLP